MDVHGGELAIFNYVYQLLLLLLFILSMSIIDFYSPIKIIKFGASLISDWNSQMKNFNRFHHMVPWSDGRIDLCTARSSCSTSRLGSPR